MMPITPNGTDIFVNLMPFGRVVCDKIRPSGEGNVATFRISDAMSAMRCSVSFRRSYFGFDLSIRSKSALLASKIEAQRFSVKSPKSVNTRLISASFGKFTARDASCDFSKIEFISIKPLFNVQSYIFFLNPIRCDFVVKFLIVFFENYGIQNRVKQGGFCFQIIFSFYCIEFIMKLFYICNININ